MKNKISKNDMVALNFRENLFELCNKYNCSIYGTTNEYISLEIYDEINKKNTSYILKNLLNGNYRIYKENEDNSLMNIMECYIKNVFDKDSSKLTGLNNIKVSYGIITNDSFKAEHKLLQIKNNLRDEDVYSFSLSNDYKNLKLKDGTTYSWFKPQSGIRGYRFKNIIIDKDISFKELNEIVLPLCCACGRENIEIF